MDAEVSASCSGPFFQYGTPMHYGAVIIQGVKIAVLQPISAHRPGTFDTLRCRDTGKLWGSPKSRTPSPSSYPKKPERISSPMRTADAVQPGCTAPLLMKTAAATGREAAFSNGACSEYSPEGGVQHSRRNLPQEKPRDERSSA